jgi:hypothetical protein
MVSNLGIIVIRFMEFYRKNLKYRVLVVIFAYINASSENKLNDVVSSIFIILVVDDGSCCVNYKIQSCLCLYLNCLLLF